MEDPDLFAKGGSEPISRSIVIVCTTKKDLDNKWKFSILHSDLNVE